MAGQDTVGIKSSVMAILFSVTDPLFTTSNSYVKISPTAVKSLRVARFSKVKDGFGSVSTVAVSFGVKGAPFGGVAEAVALLTTSPASTTTQIQKLMSHIDFSAAVVVSVVVGER